MISFNISYWITIKYIWILKSTYKSTYWICTSYYSSICCWFKYINPSSISNKSSSLLWLFTTIFEIFSLLFSVIVYVIFTSSCFLGYLFDTSWFSICAVSSISSVSISTIKFWFTLTAFPSFKIISSIVIVCFPASEIP